MTAAMPAPKRRRRVKMTPLRILIALALLAAVTGGGGTWLARNWAPDRARYPLQGVTISAASGAIQWPAVKAAGVDFAYLRATAGGRRRDPAFAANLQGATAAGLRHGAVHDFSLCETATAQATAFIATVPRDPAALPPVVALDLAPACGPRPSRDRLIAELDIFLNQIELHSGKPALLRFSREAEAAYDLSAGIDRTLWLEGQFFAPDYATRPWVMWTASTWRRVPGIEGPIEWDVVRP